MALQNRKAWSISRDFFSGMARGITLALQAYLRIAGNRNRVTGIRRSCAKPSDCDNLGLRPAISSFNGTYHKGGPDNGLFVQFVADDQLEAPIPGRNYGFGTFKQAQALGDFQALQKHGRRVMKVNLGQNIIKGLKQFRGMVDQAIAGA